MICIGIQEGGPCNGSLGDVMTCLLTNFTSTTSNMMKSDIAYTVMFGAVPGPDFTMQQLTLTVRPDPVFLEDVSAIKDTSVDVDSLLRITVSLIIVKSITISEFSPLTSRVCTLIV